MANVNVPSGLLETSVSETTVTAKPPVTPWN
jgi:hypothetical protein